MRTAAFLTILFLSFSIAASAQYDTRIKHVMKHKPGTEDSTIDDEDEMEMDENMPMAAHTNEMRGMAAAQSLYLPMNRNGSGTSWLPDATPMYGYMKHSKKWMFMFHGDIFVRYNKQDIFNAGSRGAHKLDAPDMLMAMGQRKIGQKGLFHFNVMLSTDALIAGGSGYPLLFQTGESWQGKPLIDRQHPHDLFSELSVSYAYALSPKADVYVYLGYPGEPAVGPVTFMHRPSGRFMADAPISHHWADATHITFGVATLGFRYGRFKIEGSSFTGREPNEERFDFDKPLFNSFSGRLSYNPTGDWALQVSHAYIKSPEALNAAEDVNRTTASATYFHHTGKNKYITATALLGQNISAGHDPSNAALLEGTLKVKKLALYARYEFVQKSGEELNLSVASYSIHQLYYINTLTTGGSYDLFAVKGITVAGGLQIAAYKPDAALTSLYGDFPLSGQVFLHFYPKLIN